MLTWRVFAEPVCGQDEQLTGNDQLYTGSGSDDTLHSSITLLH